MFKVETKFLPIKCAGMSLIGVGPERPTSWGNYFWITDRIRILNMWWENLASLKYELENTVKVRIYDDEFGIIIDERVPEEYLYNKLCYTGGRFPPKEIVKDIFNLLGDPTNEFELFEDPVSYYAKRGGKYNPTTGIVTYTFKSEGTMN